MTPTARSFSALLLSCDPSLLISPLLPEHRGAWSNGDDSESRSRMTKRRQACAFTPGSPARSFTICPGGKSI